VFQVVLSVVSTVSDFDLIYFIFVVIIKVVFKKILFECHPNPNLSYSLEYLVRIRNALEIDI